ncbi:SET domain-containing protein-lysine N-methyltransferase [Streptomyces sp. NPDC004787]|uniref:SET domain-containing protein-lysine N-methyltransferase n=1 Tax=Streptomyces sp. NPDC004787 TaxID=3154291 RepID=UPI0033B7A341
MSSLAGAGAFAVEEIPRGAIVHQFKGRVVDEDELRESYSDLFRSWIVQLSEDRFLVPEDRWNDRGAINHSCDSNLVMLDSLTLVARQRICAGDEVTVDYSLFHGEPGRLLDAVRCKCGSIFCREQVDGSDWRRTELRERYGVASFSPFLQRRIAAASISPSSGM